MSEIINIPPISANITGGSIDVNASIGEDRSSVNTRLFNVVVDAMPSVENTVINYTVPAGKQFVLHTCFGVSSGDMEAILEVNGEEFNSQKNHQTNPNVNLSIGAPFLIDGGQSVRILATNRSIYGTQNFIKFWVYGYLFIPD